MKTSTLITVDDSSQVGDARRAAQQLALEVGFDETRIGVVSIISNELSTNLAKHARNGQLILRHLEADDGLEILALDKGPGIANIAQALQDGFSTAGSAGTGLGAIQRMADVFEIHSIPGIGTAILAQIWKKPGNRPRPTPGPFEVSAINVPVRGEAVSGDGWSFHQQAGRGVFFVSDGLGHGPEACAASDEAVRIFEKSSGDPGAVILQWVHEALKKTRGAAIAVTEILLSEGRVSYAGIGNIAGAILAGAGIADHQDRAVQRMISQNGTAGVASPKAREFSYKWPAGGVLLMHSDGLVSHWSLEKYPGLLGRHTSLIAGVLFRDYVRGRDDTTVLVARARGSR